MHVLQMATQIAALREELPADFTLVGPLHRVLAEVVPQVAALAEHGLAPFKPAPEVQFGSLRFAVVDFDSLMPLLGDALKLLGIRSLSVHIGRTFAGNSTILLFLGACGGCDRLSTSRAWLVGDEDFDGLFRCYLFGLVCRIFCLLSKSLLRAALLRRQRLKLRKQLSEAVEQWTGLIHNLLVILQHCRLTAHLAHHL